MKVNWMKYLYAVTILFFTLGFFNIVFAWLGFVCLILPFVLLIRDKKKTWCQRYCPRANLFTVLFKGKSLTGKAAPEWITKGIAKRIILIYFSFNLFALVMSTIMVSLGRIEAVDHIRFVMAFQLPWNIPQLLNIPFLPDWAVHLSFRIYSMMFSTTVIGLLLGWVFTPRTWCTICPVNTISDISLKNE
ncbi:MAG TPA: 4Fe-4S binding protein, partial [Patescibacteria group bacterium]|nr:4Fe-4S binding protein [Patescibacteria group bacterium]